MNNSNNLFLIIRSGSITGLLFSSGTDGISQFHEFKKDIIFDKNLEHRKDDTETYKVLSEVIENCIDTKVGLPLPDKTVCIYSSPWFTSQISEYDIPDSKKGFKYDLLNKISEDASNLDDDYVLVEQNIEAIKLNGYTTNNPEGQKYSDGTATLLTSWISNEAKEGIESVVRRFLNDREIQHMILPRIMTTVIGSHDSSYHFLDIHGEYTDIINIQDDNIDSTGSIPVGVHNLVRSIQKNNQTYHEAYEELGHIIKNIKDPINHRVEKENMTKVLLDWSKKLADVPDFRDNNNIILLSQNNTGKLFIDALNNNQGDHNTEVMMLDKEYFNSEGSSLDITSIIILSFWSMLEKRGVVLNK